MNAILTLSLGGTYPAPPNTRRGTIARPIAAAAVCPKNLRREIEDSKKLRDRSRFSTVPAIVTRSQLRSFPGFLGVPDGLRRVTVVSLRATIRDTSTASRRSWHSGVTSKERSPARPQELDINFLILHDGRELRGMLQNAGTAVQCDLIRVGTADHHDHE